MLSASFQAVMHDTSDACCIVSSQSYRCKRWQVVQPKLYRQTMLQTYIKGQHVHTRVSLHSGLQQTDTRAYSDQTTALTEGVTASLASVNAYVIGGAMLSGFRELQLDQNVLSTEGFGCAVIASVRTYSTWHRIANKACIRWNKVSRLMRICLALCAVGFYLTHR